MTSMLAQFFAFKIKAPYLKTGLLQTKNMQQKRTKLIDKQFLTLEHIELLTTCLKWHRRHNVFMVTYLLLIQPTSHYNETQ